jgi:hypothetical protein
MARKRKHQAEEPAAETAAIVPTTQRPKNRRRVPPDQANPDGPHWYRGATPWNNLTAQERLDVHAAAENSVKFWEGPASS